MEDFDDRSWSGVSEIMKKAVFAGLGALFMTEESIKKYVSDAKLPKNIGKYVLENAQKRKEELFQLIARELADLISKAELSEEAFRFLAEHKVRVAAEIEFVPREGGEAERGLEARFSQATSGSATKREGEEEWSRDAGR